MKSFNSNYEEKYKNYLKFLNLSDKPMPIKERNNLVELFAGAYEEHKLLLLTGFPDISENTLDQVINLILSDSLFNPSAINRFSKN